MDPLRKKTKSFSYTQLYLLLPYHTNLLPISGFAFAIFLLGLGSLLKALS